VAAGVLQQSAPRQVGVGGTAVDFTNCVVNFGVLATAAAQLPASDVVLVYPYNGQSDVVAAFNNQAEFPIPVADLSGVGHPVGLLASSQATGPGVVVDTNGGSTELFLVPTAALAARASTGYTVSFTGVFGGKAVTKPGRSLQQLHPSSTVRAQFLRFCC